MSVSQFDDLMEEFGDNTTTKTTSIGAYDEEFDPFGPSQGAAQTADLLDISADTGIENGYTSHGVDLDFGVNTASVPADHLHNMSNNELESGSANPQYDFSAEVDTTQSSNAQYDFGAETTTSSKPTNLLYDDDDFDNNGTTEEAAENVDLLSGANELQDDTELEHISQSQDNDADLLGDFEVLQKEEVVNEQYQSEQFVTEHQESEEYPEQDEGVEEAKVEEHAPAEEEFSQAPPIPDVEEEAPAEEYISQPPPIPDVEEEAPAEEYISQAPPIPDVEITEVPEQDDNELDDSCDKIQHEPVIDVEVREEVDEEVVVVAVDDEVEAAGIQTTDIEQDSLVAESFGHDRREKDLEHYCMDREESDLMEDQEVAPDLHMDSLKPREERSRSPSRSIGPDTPEDRERHDPSATPETDTTEDVDTLRPREDRSHAPSRSLEREEKPKGEEISEDGHDESRTAHTDNRYSGLEETQPTRELTTEQQRQEVSVHVSDIGRQLEKQDATLVTEVPPTETEPALPPRREVPTAASAGSDSQPHYHEDEEEEEGIYENQPTKRDDVVREADTDRTADLPVTGTAHNLREKFLLAQQEAAAPTRSKREITPPAHGAGGEYVSEPRGFIERYEGKADSGIFESQPVVQTDVITSGTALEEAKIEAGFAKSTAAKFKELQNKPSTPSGKRELTPDRTGQVEYVSEPRGHLEQYEGKSESGVFESEPVVNPDVVRSGEEVKEELPERGTAKNLADKFRQISTEPSSTSPSVRGKREITPDRSGRVEYVSEPRGQRTEDYEVRVDAGVFENEPQRNTDVITSDSVAEDAVPEKGYAKNVAAKFKELETTVKSPPLSPGRRKEFTPPREDERFHRADVLESTPDFKSDVIHSGDQLQEALPERGTAKNIAQKFRQLETDSKTPGSFKAKKEITPPPGDSGVFENQPKQFQADYNKPAESGIIENEPVKRDDVVRGDEPPKYEVELPERGAAKNLVNKWKQLESEGTKVKSPSSTGRPKEFTPPREEPRIAEQRKSPRTPLSPSGNEQLDNGSVHPSDLPGQYQPQNEPSVFESSPQQRSDVLREGDSDWTEGMPKKDTAKKMLARFQNIQAEANKQTPGPASRKETETPRKTPRKDSTCSESEGEHEMDNFKQKFENQVGRSKSMRAAIRTEKCGACEKTVYAMERLEMNKRVYHKACFRCTHCKAVLTPKTFAINNETIFCTAHYKQLFATKGNYDEGFGRMQHKKRWNSNPDLTKDTEETSDS